MTTTILVLVGSLREGSINAQLAEVVLENTPDGVRGIIFDALAQLPFYNEDIDDDAVRPPSVDGLRAAASGAEAILLVSPEYNGSMPAVLKNAVDWLSRPFGSAVVSGLPAAVVGAAFGQGGGVWAHDEARRCLGVAGAEVLEDARLSIGASVTRFASLHPRDDAEGVAAVRGILAALVAAVPVLA
ncbi:FMN reductase [Arthrobacter sp. RIT-PI-e]|uniref:NADPH-dependent FMN reductase n=1 Tax=Arthrobacter sp. RIT-PI-e TaxID=1681197 RepID=UPI000676970C|nr:NAD(P)H-dependent oxidoreductase [Arthrobacter sp. RIT-PI-e]KNC19273.1 FMN reductase [Arthrobacter sp. RIT-PI-e]